MAYFEDFLHFLPILFGTLLKLDRDIACSKTKRKQMYNSNK